MNRTPPIPASQHGMMMTLPPGALAADGGLRSSDAGLPVGTRLGEFEITGLIGEGGFGIVYMASDHLLGRQVALKEYMPSALASRGSQAQVTVKSERHAETFEAGRRSFINEARLLAQFDHPALVKVFRFWEANGTAYMVMPYYRGRTLRQALADMAEPPSQAWLQQILLPLVDALETIHESQCYHRDIAPDNILLLGNNQPVLLDFGAARRVIGDITQALTVILKPGFAPVEQYANGPEMKQGPWTDVYALAAVVYYCATLKTPVPSVSRMIKDTLVPFGQVAGEHYDAQFCEAVEKGLAVAVDDRIQTMDEFRQALGLGTFADASGMTAFGSRAGRNGAAMGAIADGWPDESGRGARSPPGFTGSGDLDATIVDPAALERARGGTRRHSQAPYPGAAEDPMNDPANVPPQKAEKPWTPNADVQLERVAANAAQASGSRQGGPWLPVGILVAVLALGGAAVWYWNQPATSPAEPAQSSSSAPAISPPAGDSAASPPRPATPDPLATPTPVPPGPLASSPMAPPAPATVPSLVPSPVPSPVPSLVPGMAPSAPSQAGAAPDAGSVDTGASTGGVLPVGRIIDILHEQRNPDWPVSVEVASDRVKIGRDRLRFRLQSERDGYVYLLMQGTDRSHFYQLFPNGLDKNNRLRGNAQMSLPRSNWEMVAGGPAGLNRFIALVTPTPRDFTGAGLNNSQPFSEFDLALAGRVFADRGAAPFAGEPSGCKLDTQACATYGAALFEIEEY